MDKNNTTQKIDKIQKGYIQTVGRRREAVARVRLYKDFKTQSTWNEHKITKGVILVNGMEAKDYFKGEDMKRTYLEPLKVVNADDKFAFTIRTSGGGIMGQLGASVHGIARALVKVDEEEYKSILRKKGFLTRDARTRQRRMVGMGGKSRREKQSPKR